MRDEIIERSIATIKERARKKGIELTRLGEEAVYSRLLGMVDHGRTPEEVAEYARTMEFTDTPDGLRTATLWRRA